MKTKIVTETGSIYIIDEYSGIASKNGYSFSFWDLRATPDWRPACDAALRVPGVFGMHAWAAEHGEQRMPVVGEPMYIRGWDVWYMTTEIVSVDIIEE